MRRPRGNRKKFWDKEYAKKGKHLALSENPSEDLLKFLRWFEREYDHSLLGPTSSVLDIGCGNGRNIIHLSREYLARGLGFDTSEEALNQAIKAGAELPLTFKRLSAEDPLPAEDESQTLVLDMMVSHFLNKEEREKLRKEIVRVLKPDGWLFLKTFLLDEDRNAKQLLREHPGIEPGSYIHPTFGTTEYVLSEEEIMKELESLFVVHVSKKSHAHLLHGRAHKRRSISIYAQKK